MPEEIKIIVEAVRINTDAPEQGVLKGSTAVVLRFPEPTTSLILSSPKAAALSLLLMSKAVLAEKALTDESMPIGPEKLLE